MKTTNLLFPVLFSMVICLLTSSCDSADSPTGGVLPSIPAVTITDIDGNEYHTVVIGTQTWMVENLKVTRFRNGDTIPNVKSEMTWAYLDTAAFCFYNNDELNKDDYGTLYNWYAVSDPRNIAPEGWHVPTKEEWNTLIKYLGGQFVAGGKMKETGTVHWKSPNASADNSSSFTALPGGVRIVLFDLIGATGFWWSSTANTTDKAWYNSISYDVGMSGLFGEGEHTYGFSVRCVKDE